jgi:hypothetical protein
VANAYFRSGQSWVRIASGTTSQADTAIGLSMSTFLNRFAHWRVEVAFDDFRISSGALHCPSWWDDTSPDWQPVGK